jgi:hypothetical protein
VFSLVVPNFDFLILVHECDANAKVENRFACNQEPRGVWGGHVPGVWAFWGVLGSQGNNAIARALVGSIPAARALLSPWAYPWSAYSTQAGSIAG